MERSDIKQEPGGNSAASYLQVIVKEEESMDWDEPFDVDNHGLDEDVFNESR